MSGVAFMARKDRADELGDFIDALVNEWNCTCSETMAEEIRRFLVSPEGLSVYSTYEPDPSSQGREPNG